MPNDLEFATPQIKKIKKTFKEFYALEKRAKLDILESLFNFLFDGDIMEESNEQN